MKKIIKISYNKTDWPDGPWKSEPDRLEFRAHGFPCLIVRNHFGALCGYVGIPPRHPLYGKLCNKSAAVQKLDAHGGITYSNKCRGDICHKPKSGEPDNIWWFGFDCAHPSDIIPGHILLHAEIKKDMRKQFPQLAKLDEMYPFHEVYRDVKYVRGQCLSLAKQLKILA